VRAYLTVTGALFALLALAHLLRTIAESSRLTTDPGFLLEGPGIGIIAAGLCWWAWSLLRKQARSE
jgi:high-affinity Fe2+/Pb2+ permease